MPEQLTSPDLIRLRPRSDTVHASQGSTVLAMAPDGFIEPEARHGLFVHETRVLSRYSLLVNGKRPMAIALSNIRQDTWMGYYAALPPRLRRKATRPGEVLDQISQHTIEIRVSRSIGEGMHEDIDITNFTQHSVRISFAVELDADFADTGELLRVRRQRGNLTRRWKKGSEGEFHLVFDYRAVHKYAHQGEKGTAQIHRSLDISVEQFSSAPTFRAGKLRFDVNLDPGASWHTCLKMTPEIDGNVLPSPSSCYDFVARGEMEEKEQEFLDDSTKIRTGEPLPLAGVVSEALQRAKQDLSAMRLHEMDIAPDAWTVAAGIPIYVALFGRDTLTTAWQAAMLTSQLMKGTLPLLARWQASVDDAWRDEEPGKMLHEAHDGPLAALCFNPRGRYYGSVTTSPFYPRVLSELWRWTGDKELVAPLITPAMRALEWLDKYGDIVGDGFYAYQSRSSQGLRNQGWKDSSDAIVHEDGTLAEPPISLCEEQAFAYDAKMHMAQLLHWFGREDEARRLAREAAELKRRFNEVYWQEEVGFIAMGLDGQRRPIRSIASDPGHCLATGILKESYAARTAERLMQPDMFSGWGIRTLSSRHPAYNPYSYHCGSVWPVEHGAFALGFMRHGLVDHLHRLCRAIFESVMLFDFYRLPELFSGHSRDHQHPFPALYPKSNWPQAWSTSALFAMVQALLGLAPFAPLGLLFVDPHLPDWLPELTLRGLRVGEARVDLRFSRTAGGRDRFEVLEQRGPLKILRMPSRWSFSAESDPQRMDSLLDLAKTG